MVEVVAVGVVAEVFVVFLLGKVLQRLVEQITEAWVAHEDRGNFVDQRLVEQNIETPTFFLGKLHLVVPFSDVTEALGRIPHIFYVKVNSDPEDETLALFALGNLDIASTSSSNDGWRRESEWIFTTKLQCFSDSVHLDVESR